MPLFRLFVLIVCLSIPMHTLFARRLDVVTYQKLLDASDLVVIATPAETNDTGQPGKLPGWPDLPVVNVFTKFRISAILKGDKPLKEIVMHHFREKRDAVDPRLPRINQAHLVAFSPEHGSFLLFLVREDDGQYAPFDQTDPALQSVQKLADDLGL